MREDGKECANRSEYNILSIPEKIHCRNLVNILAEKARKKVTKEKGRFRSSKGCRDQGFILRKLFKNIEKREVIVWSE